MTRVLKAVRAHSFDNLDIPDDQRNEEAIARLVRGVDPTAGKNAPWIMALWRNGRILYEDISRGVNAPVYDALERFEKAKSKLPLEKRSILAYKTLGELEDILPAKKEVELPGARQRKKLDSFRAAKQSFGCKTPSGLEWRVPLTPFAAQFYGRRTKWCTAAIDNIESFHSYAESAPLFILTLPSGAQFQGYVSPYLNLTLLNSRDSEITKKEAEELKPFVSEITSIMTSVVSVSEDGDFSYIVDTATDSKDNDSSYNDSNDGAQSWRFISIQGQPLKSNDPIVLGRKSVIGKKLTDLVNAAISTPEPAESITPDKDCEDDDLEVSPSLPRALPTAEKVSAIRKGHGDWYNRTTFANKNDFISLLDGILHVDVGGISRILEQCSLGNTDDSRIHLCNIASALTCDSVVIEGDPIAAIEHLHAYLQQGAASAADADAYTRTATNILSQDYDVIMTGLVRAMSKTAPEDIAAMLDRADDPTLCGISPFIALTEGYADIRRTMRHPERIDRAIVANIMMKAVETGNVVRFPPIVNVRAKGRQTENEARTYAECMLRKDNPVSYLLTAIMIRDNMTAGVDIFKRIMETGGKDFKEVASDLVEMIMRSASASDNDGARKLRSHIVDHLGSCLSERSGLDEDVARQYMRLQLGMAKQADHIAIGSPMVAKTEAGALYLSTETALNESTEASALYPCAYLNDHDGWPVIPADENTVAAVQYASTDNALSTEDTARRAMMERLVSVNMAMSALGRHPITLDEITGGSVQADGYAPTYQKETAVSFVPDFMEDTFALRSTSLTKEGPATYVNLAMMNLPVMKGRVDIIERMHSLYRKIEDACRYISRPEQTCAPCPAP